MQVTWLTTFCEGLAFDLCMSTLMVKEQKKQILSTYFQGALLVIEVWAIKFIPVLVMMS